MNETLLRGLLVLAGYLVGAIPFGWIIARAKGVDILTQGSGNIGATNVGRVLGKRYFYLCFACDVLKGLLPTLAFGIAVGVNRPEDRTVADLWWWLAAMMAPVLGHMFSPYLGFRGGKGVATGLGSMLGLFPILTLPAAIGLGVYLLAVKLTRYVGVSSCLAAVSLPVTTFGLWLAGAPAWQAAWPAGIAVAAIALIVVVKHRGNLARTYRGTEPRAGDPIQSTPSEMAGPNA